MDLYFYMLDIQIFTRYLVSICTNTKDTLTVGNHYLLVGKTNPSAVFNGNFATSKRWEVHSLPQPIDTEPLIRNRLILKLYYH